MSAPVKEKDKCPKCGSTKTKYEGVQSDVVNPVEEGGEGS